MFEKAIQALNDGDLKSALTQMSKIEVRKTDINKVNFLYANIFFKAEDFSRSLKYLQDCINGSLLNEEVFRLTEISQRKSQLPLQLNIYQQTIKFLTASENSLNFLIKALLNADQSSFALTIIEKILDAGPNNLHVLKLKATILGKREPSWDAAETLRKIVVLEPSAQAYSNLGSVLFRLGEVGQALRYYVKSIRKKPDYEVAYYNLGNLLKDQLKYSWAIKCYEKSVELGRSKASVYNNLGNTLVEKGEYDRAEAFLLEVLAERPDVTEIRYNLGLMYIRRRNFEKGWKLFDLRWQVGNDKLNNLSRNYKCPKWDGNTDAKGTLLIWREQGVGDEIQLSGMIRKLKHNFENIIVEYDPRLVPLMARSFSEFDVRPDRATGNEDYFDYHLPIADLPPLLKATDEWQLETPFLTTDCDVSENIRLALLEKARGRKILGLSWRSGMQTKYRNLYYTKLKYWEDILNMDEVFVVNLQYGDISGDVEELELSSRKNLFIPKLDIKNDFDNTAALIKSLDLYVGPQTATLGLVGGVGTKSYSYSDSLSIYSFGRGNPGRICSHPLLHNNTTYFYDYTTKETALMNLKRQLVAEIKGGTDTGSSIS